MSTGPDGPSVEPGRPADPPGSGLRLGRLTRADRGIAVGAVVFLVLLVVPWFTSIEVGGVEYDLPELVNGLDSGALLVALLLLAAAAAWTVLPAVKDLPTPFPRGVVTVVLAALAFLLTLVEWLDTLDVGFSVAAFLAVLTVTAVLVFAVLRVRTDLRARAASARAASDDGVALPPDGEPGAAPAGQAGQPQYGRPGWGLPGYGAEPPYGQQPDGPPAPYGGPPQTQPPHPAAPAPAPPEPREPEPQQPSPYARPQDPPPAG